MTFKAMNLSEINEMIINKMEYITVPDLKDYLRETGIEFRTKELRECLYQKAVDSIKCDEDIKRLSKCVYFTSYDVRKVLGITKYRFDKMLKEEVIWPLKTYCPNVYAGRRHPVGYLFFAPHIINLIIPGYLASLYENERQA